MSVRSVRKVALAVALVTLLSFVHTSAQYALPPESSVQVYVDTLVSEYNILVNSSYPNGNPASLKAAFPLYTPSGDSFQIIAMETAPNASGYVAFIFNPIHANQPILTMDYNDTLQGITPPHTFVAVNSTFTLTNDSLEYNGIRTVFVFAMSVHSDNVTTSTVANAYAEASAIFEGQKSDALIGGVQIQTQGPPAPSGNLASNPVVQDIDAIFGSLITPILIVILVVGAIFRKRLKKLVKETFHLD